MATTVTLIDFTLHNKSSTPNSELDPSLQHNNENINNLFQFMKNSLSAKPSKTFSLNFEKVGELQLTDDSCTYDLVFSNLFDKFIIGSMENLSVFERLNFPLLTTTAAPILTVRFDNAYMFHCLKLVVEEGEEFIYATTSSCLMKINVRNLLQNNGNSVVWACEKDISNIWGVDIIGNWVFVLDFDKTFIKTFDKMTGEPGENLQVVPTLDRGYGIHIFTENEILISSHDTLKVFSKQQENDSRWNLVRQVVINAGDAMYSIYYEKHSDLIYLSHTSGSTIFVVRRSDFSIVKSFDECNANYGLAVDEKTGFLYVCNIGDNKICVFK